MSGAVRTVVSDTYHAPLISVVSEVICCASIVYVLEEPIV